MSKLIENHVMGMQDAGDYRRVQYGVLYESCLVYNTTKSSAPTRLDVWDNTIRPYRDDRATWSTRGKGFKYLDPQNNGTDDEISFLLSPESTCICADTSRSTGQPGSGQVYAKGERLGEGDTATLVFPDWTVQRVVLHFTSNGHGIATATTPREIMALLGHQVVGLVEQQRRDCGNPT